MSVSFDKVTTEAYNFVSFILNVKPDGAAIAGLAPAFTVISTKIHVLDQFKVNSILQLINGIFNAHQKLLKCFSGITTFTSVNESLFSGAFPIILVL